jgi:hypothetical protein
VNWLSNRDRLPAALPRACIFTNDWNANCFADAPVQRLLCHADTLLGLIAEGCGSRRDRSSSLPSCFGGLIVAEVGPWIHGRQAPANTVRRSIERPRGTVPTDIS